MLKAENNVLVWETDMLYWVNMSKLRNGNKYE